MAGQKFNAYYGLSCDKNGVSQDITNAYYKGQVIEVSYGGTGQGTLTAGSYVVGNGTSSVTLKTPTQVTADLDLFTYQIGGTAGKKGLVPAAPAVGGPETIVYLDNSGGWSAPATGVTSATGTANQVLVNGGTSAQTGAVTFSLPQSIATTSSPTFASVTISNTPTNASDAATKSYVDSVAQGLDVKGSVKYASTGNLSLSGTGVTNINVPSGTTSLTVGDRVLAKDQTTGSQNGIYVVASGSWTRSTDMASGSNASGAFTFIELGSTGAGSLADTGWVQTADPAVVGTDALVWTQFSGVGTNASTVTVTDDTSTNSFIYPTMTSSTSGAATMKVSSSKFAVNTSNGQLKLNNVSTRYAAEVAVNNSSGPATTIDTFTGSGAKYLLHCYQYYNGLGGAETRTTVELIINVTGTAGSFGVDISEYGMSNNIVTYNASVNSTTGLVTVTAIGINASPNVYTVAFDRVAFGLYTNA